MLREITETSAECTPTYQIMFLRNDSSKHVEVHEGQDVDYLRIQEHLKNGGSVFITSKSSQKIAPPTPRRRRALRTVTAFYFDHV